MDLHAIKSDLQNHFTDGLLTIVGSGLSAAEGIPGMSALAAQLKQEMPGLVDGDHLMQWYEISDLLDEGIDIESALNQIPPTSNVETQIATIVAEFILHQEMRIVNEVISGSKTLRFSKLINHLVIPNNGLPVITTNYDRLIEVASEVAGIGVDTMFVGTNIANFDEKESKYSLCRSSTLNRKAVRLLYARHACVFKPHGSLDWFIHENLPIRCPFPLKLPRLIITPGLNKFRSGYNQPFDRHISKANREIDRASRYLIIGYGFNDDHLETHLTPKLLDGIPALILTRTLSQNAADLIEKCDNVTAITASGESSAPGANVIFQREEIPYTDHNIWDLGIFIREVLEP